MIATAINARQLIAVHYNEEPQPPSSHSIPAPLHLRSSTHEKACFSAPTSAEAKAVADLVRRVGNLEPNTTYAYLLLCSHFAESCVVAKCQDELVGVLLGYRKPADPSRLFIWQVGTKAEMRGQGLAGAMLDTLKARAAAAGATHFELTIAPSNESSWLLFKKWAKRSGLNLKQEEGFSSSLFGDEGHEAEALVVIGPF